MGVDHIFNGVGNHLARGEGVEHSVVSHGDAVVDGYGVEFGGEASETFDLGFHYLSGFMQMGVAGDELREGVDNGNYRTAELLGFHASGAP